MATDQDLGMWSISLLEKGNGSYSITPIATKNEGGVEGMRGNVQINVHFSPFCKVLILNKVLK